MKVFIFAVECLHVPGKKFFKLLGYLKEQEDFIGIHPHYPDGDLLVWKTLNAAKIAKNTIDALGINTANHIMNGTFDEDKQDLLVLGPET